MSWPFDEEPITEREEQLIRQASGHLYRRCQESRGKPEGREISAEHDAMMRLRRRNEQVEAALTAKDAEIARLQEVLAPFARFSRAVLSEVTQDATFFVGCDGNPIRITMDELRAAADLAKEQVDG